jgi:phenylpyruvate tautomerase PptA (4-oxalocrotonate tautomerase family)
VPVYTCTAARGTLTSESKDALAAEITRIHAAINKVPPAYVYVTVSELPAESVFAGGEPGETADHLRLGATRTSAGGADAARTAAGFSRLAHLRSGRTPCHGGDPGQPRDPPSKAAGSCPSPGRRKSGCVRPRPEVRSQGMASNQ